MGSSPDIGKMASRPDTGKMGVGKPGSARYRQDGV